ncbi:MAG TPA: hypothetical protein VEA19_00680 [Actinomycetota bacterium]|nr:hypothetical protein [Actinomycetota bacterium]
MRWRGMAFAVALSVAVAGPALAQGLSIQVGKKAQLFGGREGVRLQVTTTCPEGAVPLEGFIYVTQRGIESDFGGLPLICDGEPHTGTVSVHTFDDLKFKKGKANWSGYILLESGESISPSGTVQLKK